ncbi:MAG: hypothetical protein NVV83_21405 [Afipia sp.]|nr:hypothetical protein [Afipia sp.]
MAPSARKPRILEAADPVGAGEVTVGEDLLDGLGVNGDAGHVVAEHGVAQVEQAGSRSTDEHDVAGDAVGQPAVVRAEEIGGRDRHVGVGAAVVEPQVALGGEGNVELADAHALDIAGGGRIAEDDDGADTEGQPQGLDREGWVHVAAIGPDHGQAAHGAGRQAGIQAEHGEAGRRVAQDRQRRGDAVEIGDAFAGVGPGNGEAAFGAPGQGSTGGGLRQPQNGRRARQRGSKHRVVVGQGTHIDARNGRRDAAGGHAIGFGKQEVVADRCGAQFGQAVGNGGEPVARPGPLAQFGQRPFVHVDDANREILLFTRLQALVEIEAQFARHLHREGVGDAQQRQQHDDAEAGEEGVCDAACQAPVRGVMRFVELTIGRRIENLRSQGCCHDADERAVNACLHSLV